MKTKWLLKPQASPKDLESLQQELNLDPVLTNLLIQRGIKTFDEAKKFFRPDLSNLYDPFLMKDMDKAVERLTRAIQNQEKILVYGDYDVDGTTAVALVYTYLRDLYPHLDYYIPDRYDEGYGISYKGIDYAAENGITLVIALDCGIKAVEKMKYATQKGIDFIICDHHTADDTLPQTAAVLDPKRKDCLYPFKELSGCGVGFKFLQAFHKTHFPDDEAIVPEVLMNCLDLVCVSIASDIVPIIDENRILAYYGLLQLNSHPRTGFQSVIEVAGIKGKEISVSDIVFKIGPRINAAGRIESGRKAVDLLISENVAHAEKAGHDIDDFNTDRKDKDAKITQEAIEIIKASESLRTQKTTVLFRPHWHKGVIGIVASRLIESYYRPTVILTESHGLATGSARSVEGFNLYGAIEACSDLLENFGGHRYAAGLTMKLENVPLFQERFEKIVAEMITDEQLVPQIEIDADINFSDITPKFYRILKQFAPFGPGNMKPLFMTRFVKDCGMSKLVGADATHLKLDVMQKGKAIGGIGFGMGTYYESIASGQLFDVCYNVYENEFNGKTSLQMMVRDIKIVDE